MKPNPRTPFENFTRAMDGLMTVPHSALKAALDQEQQERIEKAKRKRARISPASREARAASDTQSSRKG
jgi:hypothetical protein